jgi:hypothetical protein
MRGLRCKPQGGTPVRDLPIRQLCRPIRTHTSIAAITVDRYTTLGRIGAEAWRLVRTYGHGYVRAFCVEGMSSSPVLCGLRAQGSADWEQLRSRRARHGLRQGIRATPSQPRRPARRSP